MCNESDNLESYKVDVPLHWRPNFIRTADEELLDEIEASTLLALYEQILNYRNGAESSNQSGVQQFEAMKEFLRIYSDMCEPNCPFPSSRPFPEYGPKSWKMFEGLLVQYPQDTNQPPNLSVASPFREISDYATPSLEYIVQSQNSLTKENLEGLSTLLQRLDNLLNGEYAINPYTATLEFDILVATVAANLGNFMGFEANNVAWLYKTQVQRARRMLESIGPQFLDTVEENLRRVNDALEAERGALRGWMHRQTYPVQILMASAVLPLTKNLDTQLSTLPRSLSTPEVPEHASILDRAARLRMERSRMEQVDQLIGHSYDPSAGPERYWDRVTKPYVFIQVKPPAP